MSYKKTHKGQSANQILKSATVAMSEADMACVWVKLDGVDYQCRSDDDGDLVMDAAEDMICMECGKAAAERLEQLEEQAEAMQIEDLKSKDAKNGTEYSAYL